MITWEGSEERLKKNTNNYFMNAKHKIQNLSSMYLMQQARCSENPRLF